MPEQREQLLNTLTEISHHLHNERATIAYQQAAIILNFIRYVNSPTRLSESIQISSRNPRQLEYYHLSTNRIQHAKPFTVFKYIARQAPHLGLQTEYLSLIATVYGDFVSDGHAYTFELVTGNDIKDLYDATQHTCMTRSPSLAFYTRNRDRIHAVHIKRRNQTIGRAILWTLTKDRYFLDRIYPNQGHHIHLLREHAEQEGWITRPGDSASLDYSNIIEFTEEHVITIPLLPANDSERSAHSAGGFPFQDTLRYMKHSPDFSQVMLRFSAAIGWVQIGAMNRQYQNQAYCPLLRGWAPESSFTTTHVLNPDGTFRPETRFLIDVLRRTHTLVRWPKSAPRPPDGNFIYRAYAPNDSDIVTTHNGAQCLRQHAVPGPRGTFIFADEALPMHDGTYATQRDLVHLARLPNGLFIRRDEATYDLDTREWSPK